MSRTSVGAAGGLFGPVCFVIAWSTLGAQIDGYSYVRDAISEIARTGRSTHSAMTAGFAGYSVGMAAFALALYRRSRWAGSTALINAVATAGVALAPLGSRLSDQFHFVFAFIAYVSLSLLPVIATRRTGKSVRFASGLCAIAIAACLCASISVDESHGLYQRLGLTVGDVWTMAAATALIRLDRRTRFPESPT